MSHTVQDCINEGERLFNAAELFYGHGTDNPADEALWLVFYHLGLSWQSDDSVLQQSVSVEDYQVLNELFRRRIDERIPAAYLTGEAWFAGYPFIVNKSVLIPRSPMAELIANGFSPWLKTASPSVLDLCTGCGCIGIATAMQCPDAQVTLSDISTEAIAVAQRNMEKHQLSDRVVAVESDGFEQLKGQKFDLILCNPPYVDSSDLAAMPAEYHAEPELALGSGEDGLDFTRGLLREAANHLTEEGVMIVEVGNSWVNLEAAFPSVSFVWLEFEYGGHGVFAMTKQELLSAQAAFV